LLQVDSHYAAGRVAQARAASIAAKRFNIAGLIIGTFLIAICVVIVVVLVIVDANEDDDYNYDY